MIESLRIARDVMRNAAMAEEIQYAEGKIIEGFGLKMEEERVVAIVGVPDQVKGEALVLLSTRDLSLDKIRELLLTAGLPNLWVPRTIKRVEKIPILGSGKIDLGKCKELALT